MHGRRRRYGGPDAVPIMAAPALCAAACALEQDGRDATRGKAAGGSTEAKVEVRWVPDGSSA